MRQRVFAGYCVTIEEARRTAQNGQCGPNGCFPMAGRRELQRQALAATHHPSAVGRALQQLALEPATEGVAARAADYAAPAAAAGVGRLPAHHHDRCPPAVLLRAGAHAVPPAVAAAIAPLQVPQLVQLNHSDQARCLGLPRLAALLPALPVLPALPLLAAPPLFLLLQLGPPLPRAVRRAPQPPQQADWAAAAGTQVPAAAAPAAEGQVGQPPPPRVSGCA